MTNYFCHKCSFILGYLNSTGIEGLNLTGSTYLLDKFVKHTLSPNNFDFVSIFSDSSYEKYKDNTINTLMSGSTIVNNNKIDVVWFSNKDIGITFLKGKPYSQTDVVKTVLHHNSKKIHSYPINSETLINKNCNNCGINILTNK